MLCNLLEADGVQVVAVGNGREALDRLKADEGRFDTAILNARMPFMTGLEVLRASRPTARGLPIILVTSFNDGDVEEQALKLGAARVLQKPFDYSEDLRRILQDFGLVK
jgi:two-component system response regulator (stage 0 sporulation protein F)